MCDLPVPCACTLERRNELRAEYMERSERLSKLAYRLRSTKRISEADACLLYQQSEMEWDDAIHIASLDDPLRSLCGSYGRNLVDLPERPDSWGGCWGCLQRADQLAPAQAEAKELVPA